MAVDVLWYLCSCDLEKLECGSWKKHSVLLEKVWSLEFGDVEFVDNVLSYCDTCPK